MENIELAYSLFNQYLYQEAKNNIDLIDYYFQTSPGTMGNKLIESLVDSVRKYPLESLDMPLFQSIMMKTGKSPAESQKIIGDIVRWKSFDKNQMAPAKQFLRDICASSLIQRANGMYQNSPSEFLKYLKQVDLKTDTSDVMSTADFDKIDINSMVADGLGIGYSSRYDWINCSFQPLNQYEAGQMVMVSMPPGCMSGDTEVFLADGTTKTLEELYLSGKEKISVYSCDGEFPKISVAENCQISKYVTEWYVVEIDGKEYRVTENHPFMMIDGTWKRADQLHPGDILMPFNIMDENTKETTVSTGKYTKVWTRDKSVKFRSHNLSGLYLKNKNPRLFSSKEKLVVHHKTKINGKKMKIMSSLKFGKKLISEYNCKSLEDLESIWDEKRYKVSRDGKKEYLVSPRTPKLNSAKIYLGEKFKDLFNLCNNYNNHEITKVWIEKLDTPKPVYDLVNVDIYHNYAVKFSEGSGFFSHNTGKTLFMMGEALTMAANGARCHYLAMGDMKPRDFVVRMGAIFSGLSFAETVTNLGPIYNSLRQTVGDRLGITVVPSAKITAEQYIEYIKEKDYDILFIDYDSNFLSKAEDNMYSEYGKIYDQLTELTQLGKLVFVAAQPKISSWNLDTIQLDMVGESARKIHTVDILLTAGKAQTPNHLGIFKICKNRRGEEGVEMPYIRLGNGRFKFIPRGMYSSLIQYTEKHNYTEAEIDQMAQQYQAQMAVIQSQNSKVINSIKSSNPFTNKP